MGSTRSFEAGGESVVVRPDGDVEHLDAPPPGEFVRRIEHVQAMSLDRAATIKHRRSAALIGVAVTWPMPATMSNRR